MPIFTDLLDAYLEARDDLKKANEAWQGRDDFEYFNHRTIDREESARNALNAAFAKATGANHE